MSLKKFVFMSFSSVFQSADMWLYAESPQIEIPKF